MSKVFKQFWNSSRYSLDGLAFLVQNEFAARLEFYALLWGGLLFFYLDVPLPEIVMALVLFCLLVAMEAINTAIEVVIDRISPEISKTGKHAKDLGSFAVMCAVIANLVYVAYVLHNADIAAALSRIRENPVLLLVAMVVIMLTIYGFAKLVKRSRDDAG